MTETTSPRGVELTPILGEVVAAEHAAHVVVPGDAPARTDVPTRTDDAARTDPPSGPATSTADPDGFRDVLPGDDPDEGRLRASRDHLDHLRATGRFVALPGPTLAVLVLDRPAGAPRGTAATARTVAVVGDVDVAAYRDGRILPHERVDPARVDALARYLEVVGTASTPVCITHRPDPAVTAATAAVLTGRPDRRFTMEDGMEVRVHLVTEVAHHRGLIDAIGSVGPLYLADGHHRAAAAAQAAGPDEHASVLTAVVPSDHLHIDAFHRRIDPAAPLGEALVLDLLRRRGLHVRALHVPATPPPRTVAHLVVGDRWWAVDLTPPGGRGGRRRLDAEVARRELVDPLLGLAGGEAVEVAIPGPTGTDALVRAGSIGIVLPAPTIEEVMAVADAGEVMPPKATYLAPKVPAGILLRPRRSGGTAD